MVLERTLKFCPQGEKNIDLMAMAAQVFGCVPIFIQKFVVNAI